MTERTTHLLTLAGAGALFLAGVATLALQILFSESVFAARLVAGLANCL